MTWMCDEGSAIVFCRSVCLRLVCSGCEIFHPTERTKHLETFDYKLWAVVCEQIRTNPVRYYSRVEEDQCQLWCKGCWWRKSPNQFRISFPFEDNELVFSCFWQWAQNVQRTSSRGPLTGNSFIYGAYFLGHIILSRINGRRGLYRKSRCEYVTRKAHI